MVKSLYFKFVFIINVLLDVTCCGYCTKPKKAFSYFDMKDTDLIINFTINIKNKEKGKKNEYGDVYGDYYVKTEKKNKMMNTHLLFFFNEDDEIISSDSNYTLEDLKTVKREDYAMSLSYILIANGKKDMYDTGQCEFDIQLDDCKFTYYYLKKNGTKRIFRKAIPENNIKDVIFTLDDAHIYKDYEKISINYSPAYIEYTGNLIYDFYFKNTNKILTIEIVKTAVQGTGFFTITAKIYYDGKLLSEKEVNSNECTFDICL